MEKLKELIESLLQSNSVPSDQGGRVVEEVDFRNVAQQIAREWAIMEMEEEIRYNRYLLNGGTMTKFEWTQKETV